MITSTLRCSVISVLVALVTSSMIRSKEQGARHGQVMATLAFTPNSKPPRASHVLNMGNWIKMVRIHACFIPATMVQFKTLCNVPKKVFVKEPMGQSGSIDRVTELSIRSMPKDSPLPQPATVAVNNEVDQGIWRHGSGSGSRSSTSPALIMLAAHAPLERTVPVGAVTTN